MYLNELLEQKGMSKYQLSKKSGIPQTTIIDICSKKARIEKCTAATIYKIAKVLDVTMEELICEAFEKTEMPRERCSFEVFKSNVCHSVKDKGDIDFIIETISTNEIRNLYSLKWYAEAFYLLAMTDYLSKENDIPLCTEYNDIRTKRLQKPLYPAGVVLLDETLNTDKHRKESLEKAIPEFLQYNIIESEIRNVC